MLVQGPSKLAISVIACNLVLFIDHDWSSRTKDLGQGLSVCDLQHGSNIRPVNYLLVSTSGYQMITT